MNATCSKTLLGEICSAWNITAATFYAEKNPCVLQSCKVNTRCNNHSIVNLSNQQYNSYQHYERLVMHLGVGLAMNEMRLWDKRNGVFGEAEILNI